MKVMVYSTKTCAYCVKLKQWLSDRGVRYDDVYIDSDTQAMKQMIELSGQMSVPFTAIEADNGEVRHVIGFDTVRLADYLGLSEP